MDIKWKKSIFTDSLFHTNLSHICESQIQKYTKEIGKVWEIFQVNTKDHSWRIAKSHHEIKQFIGAYNSKFKTNLTLKNFATEGMKKVRENKQVENWGKYLEFIQCQDLQIKKVKSIKLLKKSGGRYRDYFCCRLPWQWSLRDFVIIKSGILYYSKEKEPKQYLPFGPNFKIVAGKPDTGYDLGIRLEANHRKLMLYAQSPMDFFQFIYFIREAQEQMLTNESQNRFKSFAPVRKGNNVQFLVDGEEYFRAVAEAIERAQSQIMICGWVFSPEFQLVRPVSQNIDKRLDKMIKSAANRGVKTFILAYNESSFLTNDSAYVKQTFQALSPLVKVMRHPLGIMPTFWSHHEKLVIIDQSQAFVSGLDIAFARFDTSAHQINQNDPDYYPGMEYNNLRITDTAKTREYWKDCIPRNKPRLPFHDVGVHLVGESILDLTHHFIEYWNYVSFQTYYQDRYILVLKNDQPKKNLIKKMKNLGKNIANSFKNIKNYAGGLKNMFKQEKGDLKQIEKKMVKQQISVNLQEPCESAQQYFKPFKTQEPQQLWEQQISQGGFRPLQSKSDSQSQPDKEDYRINGYRNIGELDQIVQHMDNSIGEIDFINQTNPIKKQNAREDEQLKFQYSCQILRSVASWHIGYEPNHIERSVHAAYLDLIKNAKRFIYIENQFFISMTNDSQGLIKNQIANQIYKRIELAVHNKEEFKVWIVKPLIPGFAGEIDDANAVVPRIIMHRQYNTISRSSTSLIARIKNLGVDPKKYINFYGLRAHGIVADRPHTEMIYLHSKMIIADDQRLICGSANINQRSMRGIRDSQICVFVEQGPKIKIKSSGKDYVVSEGIHNLRLRLFREHFGEDIDATDPQSEQLWRFVQHRTHKNTEIYRQIFRCYPDDYLKTLKQVTALKGLEADLELYNKYKDQIVGFGVEYPLQFLKDENLLIGATLYPDALPV